MREMNFVRFGSAMPETPASQDSCVIAVVSTRAGSAGGHHLVAFTKTRGERGRIAAFAKGSKAAVVKTPHLAVHLYRNAVEQAPVVVARVKEDITMFRELRAEKKRAKNIPSSERTLDAAAEE